MVEVKLVTSWVAGWDTHKYLYEEVESGARHEFTGEEAKDKVIAKDGKCYLKGEQNTVIDDFFDRWEADSVQWHWWAQKKYRVDYGYYKTEIHPAISKATHILLSTTSLLPRKGCSRSIQEIIADDMKCKKTKLLSKIAEKVGAVTEVDLYCGPDGTPNGVIIGTKGQAKISTVLAGGYNVQCLHYRVLVK